MKKINPVIFLLFLFIPYLACAQGELHQAAFDRNDLLVQRLIDAGADVNGLDTHGLTPLHWAACCGNEKIINLLLKKGANINAAGTGKKRVILGLHPCM